jgi:hypothetical protein
MKEYDFFTERRRWQLTGWDRRMHEVERWKNYCYVPLDIPRIENLELVNWFFENSQPTYKLKEDIANRSTGIPVFNSVDIFPTGIIDNMEFWKINNRPDFLIKFKNILDQILKFFPFKEITQMRMWSSNMDVMWHRDQTRFTDNPNSFRIMLYDENPSQTLGLIKSLPDSTLDLSNKFMLPRLLETNSFVWNNLRTKHGSIYDPAYKKILIIIERYNLDIDRYHEIMERSVRKYKDHLLICDRKTNEYVGD